MKLDKNILILTVLIVLCATSLTFALRITADIYDNKRLNQDKTQVVEKGNFNNKEFRKSLQEVELKYNGTSFGIKSYIYDKTTLLPIDTILKRNDTKYRFLNSDDVFTFNVDQNEVSVNISQEKALIGKDKSMPVLSMYKDGNIFVGVDLIKEIFAYEIRSYKDINKAYLYNNKGFESVLSKLRFIKKSKVQDNKFELSLEQINPKTEVKAKSDIISFDKEPKVVYSRYYNRFFAIAGNKVTNIDTKKTFEISQEPAMSVDGKNLYYFDKNKNEFVLLDLFGNEETRLEAATIETKDIDFSAKKVLTYSSKNSDKILYFTQKDEVADSCLIQKGKKIYFVEKISLSPDGKNLFYQDNKNLYFLDRQKPVDDLIATNAAIALWIKNDQLVYTSLNGEKFVVYPDEGRKEATSIDMKFLGMNENSIYYKSDSRVMLSKSAGTKEIQTTRIDIKEIIPTYEENSFVIVPENGNDSLYLVINGDIRKIGEKSKVKDNEISYKDCLKTSPSKDRIFLLESFSNATEFSILDLKDSTNNRKLSLDFVADEALDMKIKWLDNRYVLCSTKTKAVIVDVLRHEDLFSWHLEDDLTIEGIIAQEK